MIQPFHWSLDLYWRIFLSLFPHCLLCITHTCLLNDNLFTPEWQSHPQEKEDLTSMIHKVKISLYMYSNCCYSNGQINLFKRIPLVCFLECDWPSLILPIFLFYQVMIRSLYKSSVKFMRLSLSRGQGEESMQWLFELIPLVHIIISNKLKRFSR